MASKYVHVSPTSTCWGCASIMSEPAPKTIGLLVYFAGGSGRSIRLLPQPLALVNICALVEKVKGTHMQPSATVVEQGV